MKRSISMFLALALILASFQAVLAGMIQFDQPALTTSAKETEPYQCQISEPIWNQNLTPWSGSENHALSSQPLRPRQISRTFRLFLVIALFLPAIFAVLPKEAIRLISRKPFHSLRRRMLRWIQFTYGL